MRVGAGGGVVQVDVPYPRFAADEPDVAVQFGPGVQVDDVVRQDHSVITGDQQRARRGQFAEQLGHAGVDLTQHRQPLRRFGTVQMSGRVEIGEIGVGETGFDAGMHRGREDARA
ncbi:hypothetical protein NRB20_58320 [Nocardia sp. RB20]|uniref:Uncharacterized protein n=1 Tax=Nocardia macrotermitis TaxID=2585198 RepID=A0A7K0DAB1_9NOCA|nr:hypothetical protein [Nocardia macrotermitis]